MPNTFMGILQERQAARSIQVRSGIAGSISNTGRALPVRLIGNSRIQLFSCCGSLGRLLRFKVLCLPAQVHPGEIDVLLGTPIEPR